MCQKKLDSGIVLTGAHRHCEEALSTKQSGPERLLRFALVRHCGNDAWISGTSRHHLKRRERRQGFTFVELLVVLGILVLLSGIVYQLFSSVGRTQKNLSDQVVLQMESRKAFAGTANQIQEGTEVVRPFIGETLPFLVYKDIINRMVILYLEPNPKVSKELKKAVYRLVSYTSDYGGGGFKKENEKILIDSLRSMTFSSLSPNSIQMNATVVNSKGEYQFLAHVGLMNIGGLE